MAKDKLVLTYEDYLRIPEDGNRHEILKGDLYVTPPPTPRHQRAVVGLVVLLHGYLSERKAGKVYPSPVGVVLSDLDVVEPDLVVVTKDRMHIVTAAIIKGPPDLVIEILSPSTAPVDRGRKMERYAHFGIREYWIVDPDRRTLEVYSLRGSAYDLVSAGGDPPRPRSVLFPDLRIETGALWD